MAIFVIGILFMLMALLMLVLEKTYFYLPKKELDRQAARGDELAVVLREAAAYGGELKILLWLVMGLSAAGGFVLFAQVAPVLLGMVVVALVLWLGFIWLPRTRLTLIGAQLAMRCTPVVVESLRVIHPLLRPLAAYVRRYHAGPHTGMYEREDMYDLVERQKRQGDNRINEDDLERMYRVVQSGRIHIREVLVSRQKVVAVNVDDDISPLLLDELHKSGHPRFPAYEGESANIVGTLVLSVVADTKHRGTVRDYIDGHVAYLHENDTLKQALEAFYQTRQHLFIVVNAADEYMGIITLSDILYHLYGAIKQPHPGHYGDRRAALARHSAEPHLLHARIAPDKVVK